MNQQLPIESQFISTLADQLNEEIVLELFRILRNHATDIKDLYIT